jgi:hypothetical protein
MLILYQGWRLGSLEVLDLRRLSLTLFCAHTSVRSIDIVVESSSNRLAMGVLCGNIAPIMGRYMGGPFNALAGRCRFSDTLLRGHSSKLSLVRLHWLKIMRILSWLICLPRGGGHVATVARLLLIMRVGNPYQTLVTLGHLWWSRHDLAFNQLSG